MKKQIRIEVEEKIDITTKTIKPKRLSLEEMEKRIVVEKKRVNRRGESSGLIPEVPQDLKERHSDLIRKSNDNSKSLESWKRFHPNCRWQQNLPADKRKTFEEDWWNTEELIRVANKGIKADAKRRRKQKIKYFFYVASGRRFLDLRRVKKDEEKEDAEIAQEFLDKIALEEFRDNLDKPLSENLYIFIDFATQKKCWLGISIPKNIEKIISDFKESRRLKDSDKINKQILLDFGRYFRQNHR